MLNSYNWSDEDGVLWRWNDSGAFTVKYLYGFLSNGGLVCPFYKLIWRILAPLKVRIHTWLLLNDCLLTGEN